MSLLTVKGLVVRTVDVKESDRLINIFTEEMGMVSAYAQGARSYKSRKMAATNQFCYGSFVLMQRADKYWIKEAELIESFFDIRHTVEGLALAAYIVDVLSFVTVTEPENDLLRLALNSLYAIANKRYELEKIKAAYEIRALSIIGYMPDVLSCRECGEKHGDFYLDVIGGNIECSSCHAKLPDVDPLLTDRNEARVICILSESAKIALGYCIYSPIEKIFSFKIPDEDMHLFSRATEEYLLNQLERSFNTLEFYHSVKPTKKSF